MTMTWKGDDDVQGLLLLLLHRHPYTPLLCYVLLIWILIMSFNFHIFFHHFMFKLYKCIQIECLSLGICVVREMNERKVFKDCVAQNFSFKVLFYLYLYGNVFCHDYAAFVDLY